MTLFTSESGSRFMKNLDLGLLKHSSLIAFLTDFDANIKALNPSAETWISQYFPLPEESTFPLPLDLKQSDSLSALKRLLEELSQRQEGGLEPQEVVFFHESQIHWLEVQLSFVDGDSDHALFLIRDQTAHKWESLQQTWSQNWQSVSLLASGIAHEFNNLMTSMAGYRELFLENDMFKEKFLKVVGEGVDRGVGIVDRLLYFAHARRMGAEDEPVLQQSVQSAIELLEVEFQRRKIEVELQMESDLHYQMRMSSDVLHQLLIDLLTNAVHAIGQDGKVMVSVKLEDGDSDLAVVRIKDSGCGMQEGQLRKLFTPFHTTKGSFGGGKEMGNGLALYSLYTIVHACGGDVGVQSAVGLGSVFTVKLPVKKKYKPSL